MRTGRPRSEDKEALLLEAVEAGRPIQEVCDELGVSRATGHRWVKESGVTRPKKPTKYSEFTGNERRYLSPVNPPIEGRPDPKSLQRFAALVAEREVKGMTAAVFTGEDWALLLHAKLAVQEFLAGSPL